MFLPPFEDNVAETNASDVGRIFIQTRTQMVFRLPLVPLYLVSK